MPKPIKIPRTYRLSQATVDNLAAIIKSTGTSETATVEMAVALLRQKIVGGKMITPEEAAKMVEEALNNWDFSADTNPPDGENTRKGLEYMQDQIPDGDIAASLNALGGDKWDALSELALNYGREL